MVISREAAFQDGLAQRARNSPPRGPALKVRSNASIGSCPRGELGRAFSPSNPRAGAFLHTHSGMTALRALGFSNNS